jgi:exopolyphosphatase/guanosine-5'-triphosphate,3'-diphosphate pyrophosphatase
MAGEPVAVVDIGSNSGRVMVYRPEPGGHLHILAGSRASLRLARGLDDGGRIPDEALERTFEALRDFRSIARGSGVRRIVAAGTSALRDAANGPAFVRRVRRELGFSIRVLSGVEEARYGFLGAVGGLPVDDGALFDLGGGSLQVVRFRDRKLVGATSVPLGALRVSDAFLEGDPPSPREIRRLREHARGVLTKAGVSRLGEGEELVGTGGTLRNVAKVDQRSAGYPIARLHGYVLTRGRLRDVVGRLASEKQKKRGRTPGLNSDRRDSIVGGAVVIETLVDVLGAGEILVSGQGVREGMALGLSRETLAPSAVVRRSSLEGLARRFSGWSADRAERRAAAARALQSALLPAVGREMQEALEHGARVLDIGRTVDFFDRHEHVADLVLATDLAGFSHRQVALLAAVVAAAGEEENRLDALAPLVRREDRGPVRQTAVVLAFADEITERSPPGSTPGVDVRGRSGRTVVTVRGLESWGVRGLDEHFEEAFGRPLRVVPSPSRRRR